MCPLLSHAAANVGASVRNAAARTQHFERIIDLLRTKFVESILRFDGIEPLPRTSWTITIDDRVGSVKQYGPYIADLYQVERKLNGARRRS